MDTFEPLVELRGEWRQAAAISIPAAAAPVSAALDRALDVLVDADQVDEESLTMAAETVCKAVIARADEVELLRRRLHRAIRDYITVTAIDDAPMSTDGGAFDSEEALAAALFASVGEAIGEDDELFDTATPDAATAGGKRRIDEKALKKKLSAQPGRTKKRVIGFIKLAIPLGLVAVAVGAVLLHPEWLTQVRGTGTGPTVTAAAGLECPVPTGAAVLRSGCFQNADAACPGGTVQPGQCGFTFTVNSPGVINLKLRWDTGDTLQLQLFKSDGKTAMAAPVSGGDGTLTLSLPNLAAGSYTLRITNTAKGADLIHFNVSAS